MKTVVRLDATGIDKLQASLIPRAEKIIAQTAFEIEGDAKKRIMSPPKTGRIYYHLASGKRRVMATIRDTLTGKSSRTWTGQMRSVVNRIKHQASKKGEAPATDTGALANSIIVEGVTRLTLRVGPTVEYGEYLELGTSRIAKRPFLIPAVEKYRAKFEQHWAELFK